MFANVFVCLLTECSSLKDFSHSDMYSPMMNNFHLGLFYGMFFKQLLCLRQVPFSTTWRGRLEPLSKDKSKRIQGSEDTPSSQGTRQKIHTLSTTLSMKLQISFISMKQGYRSFPEVIQPTSARAYLDLDKC